MLGEERPSCKCRTATARPTPLSSFSSGQHLCAQQRAPSNKDGDPAEGRLPTSRGMLNRCSLQATRHGLRGGALFSSRLLVSLPLSTRFARGGQRRRPTQGTIACRDSLDSPHAPKPTSAAEPTLRSRTAAASMLQCSRYFDARSHHVVSNCSGPAVRRACTRIRVGLPLRLPGSPDRRLSSSTSTSPAATTKMPSQACMATPNEAGCLH